MADIHRLLVLGSGAVEASSGIGYVFDACQHHILVLNICIMTKLMNT
jgi:hypothetical protein